MTLKEWSRFVGYTPTHPTETGAVSVTFDEQDGRFFLLWNLSDYRVSSRSGPVVRLTPMKPLRSDLVKVRIGRTNGSCIDREVDTMMTTNQIEVVKDVLCLVNAVSANKERWYVSFGDQPEQIIPIVKMGGTDDT